MKTHIKEHLDTLAEAQEMLKRLSDYSPKNSKSHRPVSRPKCPLVWACAEEDRVFSLNPSDLLVPLATYLTAGLEVLGFNGQDGWLWQKAVACPRRGIRTVAPITATTVEYHLRAAFGADTSIVTACTAIQGNKAYPCTYDSSKQQPEKNELVSVERLALMASTYEDADACWTLKYCADYPLRVWLSDTAAREVFKLRDNPDLRKRRQAIRHIVSEHFRKVSKDNIVTIPAHMRGVTEILLEGETVQLIPPKAFRLRVGPES